MPNPSARKGYRGEVDFCAECIRHNVSAERARGSDGRSLGRAPEVDAVIRTPGGEISVQVKVRKAIAGYTKPTPHVDIVAMREVARGPTVEGWLVVLPLEHYLDLVKESDDVLRQSPGG